MLPKRILLIGYNFAPELTGIGRYSGEMMHWLAAHGHDCTVLTAYPYYPHWRVQEPYHGRRFWYHTETTDFPGGGRLTVCRCPMYVPAQPTGLKRMLLDASFLASASLKLGQLLFQPRFDLVVAVAPSFQLGLLGVLYRKIRGGRFLYHIQDLQIEAAKELNIIRNERAIQLLFKAEGFINRRADFISSISEGMIGRLATKAGRPVASFPNWVDTSQFYPLPDRAALKEAYGFAPTDKIVLYSGAIGEKQGLEAILHAAAELPGYRFVICGSGPYKARLEEMARELGLANVSFLPLQPMEAFNRFLNLADVHLVIQKANASDLVMPSKLTTILAAGGTAVVTANPGTSLHTVVGQHRLGILAEPENQAALTAAIRQALAEAEATSPRARAYAEEHLAIDRIMQGFERDFL